MREKVTIEKKQTQSMRFVVNSNFREIQITQEV